MSLRLQADADLNQRIVAGVRRLEPAIDFQSAAQAGLEGRTDPDVLTLCADQARLLVTHDQKTMPQHFAAFIAERSSPGAIIVSQDLPIGQAVQELYLAWFASEAEEWLNIIRRRPVSRSEYRVRSIVTAPSVNHPIGNRALCAGGQHWDGGKFL